MHSAITNPMKFLSGLALLVAMTAVDAALPGSAADAQMSREPFQYRVHRNPTAANMAVIMKQVESGALNGGGSTASAPVVSGSSSPLGAITQYNSTTIGNMSEITTILEDGAQGYVNLDTAQDGSQSSQSSSAEGTQVFGGNAAVGNGDPTANAGTVTSNNSPENNTGGASGETSGGDQ